MRTFVTFGQDHIHKANGKVFDNNCVAVIEAENYEAGRALAFKLFSAKFCMAHPEEHLGKITLEWYPRGLISAN